MFTKVTFDKKGDTLVGFHVPADVVKVVDIYEEYKTVWEGACELPKLFEGEYVVLNSFEREEFVYAAELIIEDTVELEIHDILNEWILDLTPQIKETV